MDRPRYFIAGVSSSPIVNTFLSFDMIVMERRSASEQEISDMNDNYSPQGVVFAVPNKHCLVKLEQNSSTSLKFCHDTNIPMTSCIS